MPASGCAARHSWARERGVIALSFAVDYWDYLGWSDTLGSAANSERQRAYAHARGDGKVYTPQMVVDGVIHVNGSSEAAMEMAMRNATGAAQGRARAGAACMRTATRS